MRTTISTHTYLFFDALTLSLLVDDHLAKGKINAKRYKIVPLGQDAWQGNALKAKNTSGSRQAEIDGRIYLQSLADERKRCEEQAKVHAQEAITCAERGLWREHKERTEMQAMLLRVEELKSEYQVYKRDLAIKLKNLQRAEMNNKMYKIAAASGGKVLGQSMPTDEGGWCTGRGVNELEIEPDDQSLRAKTHFKIRLVESLGEDCERRRCLAIYSITSDTWHQTPMRILRNQALTWMKREHDQVLRAGLMTGPRGRVLAPEDTVLSLELERGGYFALDCVTQYAEWETV